jgi:hypothetical protein
MTDLKRNLLRFFLFLLIYLVFFNFFINFIDYFLNIFFLLNLQLSWNNLIKIQIKKKNKYFIIKKKK